VPTSALTPVQQDYLELMLRLSGEGDAGVRVTDIASEMGIKPPTVVRTVARLRAAGFAVQEERGLVHLTDAGRRVAEQLRHRHRDIVVLLVDVLGLERSRAERDACVIEHGLADETAERLHEFLLRWFELPDETRALLASPVSKLDSPHFNLLETKSNRGARY